MEERIMFQAKDFILDYICDKDYLILIILPTRIILIIFLMRFVLIIFVTRMIFPGNLEVAPQGSIWTERRNQQLEGRGLKS